MENQLVIINKSIIVENCLGRINEEYENNINNFNPAFKSWIFSVEMSIIC